MLKIENRNPSLRLAPRLGFITSSRVCSRARARRAAPSPSSSPPSSPRDRPRCRDRASISARARRGALSLSPPAPAFSAPPRASSPGSPAA
eukprot:31286-Pelagococcus_subviridis.AAC.1